MVEADRARLLGIPEEAVTAGLWRPEESPRVIVYFSLILPLDSADRLFLLLYFSSIAAQVPAYFSAAEEAHTNPHEYACYDPSHRQAGIILCCFLVARKENLVRRLEGFPAIRGLAA